MLTFRDYTSTHVDISDPEIMKHDGSGPLYPYPSPPPHLSSDVNLLKHESKVHHTIRANDKILPLLINKKLMGSTTANLKDVFATFY